MIILPIQGQWFDLILSGKKTEEYRDLKPYYRTRFRNEGLLDENDKPLPEPFTIMLRNGYSRKSRFLTVKVTLREGRGNPDLGAKPGKICYILEIKKILNGNL